MNTKKIIVIILSLLIKINCFSINYNLKSPDKQNEIIISVDRNSVSYVILNNKNEVIEKSPLGIKLSNPKYDFVNGLKVESIKKTRVFERYTLTTGKKRICINHANELDLYLKNNAEELCCISIRAYNDGIAYRYKLNNPETDSLNYEASSFRFKEGTIAWAMNFRPDHEGLYSERLIDTLKNNLGTGIYDYPFFGMPMLLKTPNNNWVLLHESNVMGNVPTAASSLIKNNDNSFSIIQKYPSYKPTNKNELQLFEQILVKESSKIIVPSNYISPWRVMIIGSSLKPVVESNMIENLCPSPHVDNYSWIESGGVTTFPWWGNNYVNGDTAAIKKYIDFAAEMNWKFIEFDVSLIGSPTYATDEWKTTLWVKRIVDYANSKGVNVYGWDERRNLDTPEKRADIFSRYQKLGIKGIKIDFINSIKQESMEFRRACLEDAIKYHLLVSFHGDYSPRGERRTFPNLMTNEGIKGSEFYLFGVPADYPTPVHNTTVPFTRNIIGPMDYTPVAFSTPFRKTTYAHELALSIIFESGWVGMCDKPEVYKSSTAVEFLKKLVSVWDETVFLGGYPGKYFCVARRSGNNWFIAGNNAGNEREVVLNLDFLKKGTYKVKLYCDGADALNTCTVRDITIKKGDNLKVKMAANGGFALYIPEKN